MKSIVIKSQGIKSGYQAFGSADYRGTIYIPKGFFSEVPAEMTLEGDFADPKPEAVRGPKDPAKAQAAAAKAQETASKAQARADKLKEQVERIKAKMAAAGQGEVVPVTPTEQQTMAATESATPAGEPVVPATPTTTAEAKAKGGRRQPTAV
jgi:hypothetical protein